MVLSFVYLLEDDGEFMENVAICRLLTDTDCEYCINTGSQLFATKRQT